MKSYEEYKNLLTNRLTIIKKAKEDKIAEDVKKLMGIIEKTLDDDIDALHIPTRQYLYAKVTTYDADVAAILAAKLTSLGFNVCNSHQIFDGKRVYSIDVCVRA